MLFHISSLPHIHGDKHEFCHSGTTRCTVGTEHIRFAREGRDGILLSSENRAKRRATSGRVRVQPPAPAPLRAYMCTGVYRQIPHPRTRGSMSTRRDVDARRREVRTAAGRVRPPSCPSASACARTSVHRQLPHPRAWQYVKMTKCSRFPYAYASTVGGARAGDG